ncbi:archease [Candidatus Pacearchaeota archaeon]|nr:archease [Candidatus Pacearchaeota archaeon]
MPYNFLEHTADVKFRIESPTLEEMFSSSADALNETIRGNIKILEQKEKNFEIEGKDLEELLYNFLEELLFLLDTENFLISKIKDIKIDLENKKLKCVATGDKAENYKFTNDVKAITYHEMFIKEKNGKFICEVTLDV